jgi:biopolymer transport protein ExbD
MRRQKIAKQHIEVELFPFLSILACTIGTLILLVIVLTTQALSEQEVIIVAKEAENGSNVTKTPLYIECRSNGLILYPGEEFVASSQINEPNSALSNFIAEVKANRDRKYIILTLRPNAIDTFNQARRIIEIENLELKKANRSLIDIGYEPIDASWTLKMEEEQNSRSDNSTSQKESQPLETNPLDMERQRETENIQPIEP